MKIYNSLTRNKDLLEPLAEGRIGIYVCGPTVYDDPHIGHARSAYIFDVVRRYLSYKGLEVMFVRNVTDVDDKIIDKAKKVINQDSGVVNLVDATKDISRKYLEAYHEDMSLLGIARPDKEPKATEYIPKMISFICKLIENGCAYAAGGDVYFDIKKARQYGKLSNQNLDKMEIGARISPGEKKKDPLDFALWKSAKEGEPFWPSPWGNGRPGWHIECSVMSSDILGDAFDIHGGGIDLIFPHHENEIAQSEGAGKKFAKIWMHNGLLTIDNEKMSKSLGNFISIKDFLKRHKDPDYLKLLFLNTHYRHPVDYTEDKITEMKAQKERFLIFFDKISRIAKVSSDGGRPAQPDNVLNDFRMRFEESMDDDFNTPMALAVLFDLVTHANRSMQDGGVSWLPEAGRFISDMGKVLGLGLSEGIAGKGVDEEGVLRLIKDRDRARKEKDFRAADDIRKALLKEHGVIIEDTKDGTVWRKQI